MCGVNSLIPIPKIGPLCCKTSHDADMVRRFQQLVKPIEFRKGVVKMLSCSVQVIKSYMDWKLDLSRRKRVLAQWKIAAQSASWRVLDRVHNQNPVPFRPVLDG